VAALIVTVLTASLLGSPHCAGMCGGFAAFALGAGGRSPVPGWLLHVAYNGGRLVTYVILGVLAGTLGAALDLGGSMIGLQRLAALAAGALMVVFGGLALLAAVGVRLPPAPLPEWLRRHVVRGHARALQLAPFGRALAIGLLTTLLPCGWLYAFVITAAGTASPLWGGVTMAAFWVGTLPMLLAIGAGVRRLSGWFGPRLAVVTSLAIVGVGLYTLSGRMLIDPVALAHAVQAPLGSTQPASGAEHAERLTQEVVRLDAGAAPCCQVKPEAAHGE
jgi:hypothetical protein